MRELNLLHQSFSDDGHVVPVSGVEFTDQNDIVAGKERVDIGVTGFHFQEGEGVVHSLDPSGFSFLRKLITHLLFQNFVEDSQSFLMKQIHPVN